MGRKSLDGIGFNLLGYKNVVVHDLDDCCKPKTGEIAPWAMNIVRLVGGYWEISPSGTGIRGVCWGSKTGPRVQASKGAPVNGAQYDGSKGRYITLTGHTLPESTEDVCAAHPGGIEAAYALMFPAREREPRRAANPHNVDLDDAALLEKARAARNGERFASLWEGDSSAYPSPSEADLALCSHLVFWTGGNAARIDQLFRQSGLFRPKWDERHGAQTYGEGTVAKALSGATEFYTGRSNNHQDAPDWLGDMPTDDGEVDAVGDEGAQIDHGEGPPHLTDLGNARRLVELHGHDLRFCHPWGKWMVWDGSRWRHDDTAEVYRRARRTIREIYQDAANLLEQASTEMDDMKRNQMAAIAEALSEWARKSENRARIEAMVKLAESEPSVPVLPSQLDTDHWLLNCQNGTIDLTTGQLREHRRADLITQLAPVTYDASATCPVWDGFLEKITAGNRGLILFLQKAIGYSLTGDVSEQVIFIFFGTGANGKSTFLLVTLRMLGDYAKKAPMDLFMAKGNETHPTEKTLLFGARFVAGIEAEEGKRLSEVFIKEATGGDPITARRMREDFWTFNPTHKVFLAVNHKPIIRGTDHAIWRRPKLIPFTVTIPGEEQDRRLPEKLYVELPGILAWAVQGCLDWQRNGLGEPQEVWDATSKYREDMDVLGSFIGERCLINPEVQVSIKELYNAYVEWAKASGEYVSSKVVFGQRLAERGFTKARGTKGVWYWSGIGLVADNQPTDWNDCRVTGDNG